MMNREFFRNPLTDPEYSVSGFWFWNDLITDEKTTEQLNMMKRIGANEPVVHSRFGLQNEYLSQDWFDRIKSVIEVCRKNDQRIWLYDEDNWPSGNCSWTITKEERYREHYLQFEPVSLNEAEEYTIDLSLHNYINITAYSHGEGAFDLLGQSNGKEIKYTAKGKEELIAVYVAVDAYEPVGKLCVDYLSKEAIKVFIESTHEKYYEQFGEEFGNIILGIFMDETRFCNAMPWTATLPEEFIKRKGYDLVPYLPLLVKKSDQSALIRYDYYDVISDLYTEATFLQVYEWCEKHNLKSTGHFLGEETLATQAYFGADMMRGYQYFHVPGIDHLGNGIGSLDGKFAVSASHNYGKMRVSCEAFGASGWDITFEDMVRISNWLFQQGINLILMHGFYYSIRDERSEDFPPSYFFQWKYWDHMPMYVKMANRMMEMLSNGKSENEILIYAPMETYWKYVEHDLETKTGFWEKGPWIKDENAKFIDNQYQLLCNRLIDRNMDFTIFGSDVVKNFVVEGNELVNILSKERFRVFVLPLTEILTENVVRLLNEFMNAGGVVISYRTNIKEIVAKDGRHMRGERFEELNKERVIIADKLEEVIKLCKSEIKLPFEIVCGVDEVSHSLSSYPARLIDPYIHDGERIYGVGVTRYLKGNNRILNITNYNLKEEELRIRVESLDAPEIFIPETGEIVKAKDYDKLEDWYEFDVTIPANRTYFIVCSL
jgi:hypothetical protein